MWELVFLTRISMVARLHCGKCQVLLLSCACCLSCATVQDLIRMDFSAHASTQMK